jgi:hypothetical protein
MTDKQSKIVALKNQRLSDKELAELKWAYKHLEFSSFAVRLSNFIGAPIEEGFRLLPKSWYNRLHRATENSIRKALDLAIQSMDQVPTKITHDHLHKFMAMGAGAVGGFFGPITLLAELPLITMMMLRSIADIAHANGEDLSTPEARIACMEVFALGGRTRDDDAADSGYYGIRTMLSLHFSTALVAGQNTITAIPSGVEFLRAIASRFSLVISDKAATRMIPVLGAASGAMVNLIFMKHFQDVARGHFIVRRLERKYGSAFVKKAYQSVARQEARAHKASSPLEGW